MDFEAAPHLFTLFCFQFPFILRPAQIIDNNYELYPVTSSNLQKHFVFSIRNWNEKRYHTMFTYGLVHYNITHFYNNFLTMAIFGSHIINVAGAFILLNFHKISSFDYCTHKQGSSLFWITSLNGSVCGAFASLLEYKYHRSRSKIEKTKQTTKSLWNKITEPVNGMITDYGNKVIDKSFLAMNETRGMVGCSSSVYALHALSFCLVIDRAKERVIKFWKKYVLRDESVEITRAETIQTFFDMMSLWTGIERIRPDVEHIWKDKKRRKFSFDHLVVASPDNVAHCGHMGGFLSGIATFFAWKAYRRWRYGFVYDESRRPAQNVLTTLSSSLFGET